ncbi:hypothetical protein LMH87_005325 [Akanthomyces muscarius]|uniref:F-box domain-containing protein n=1 Tax=Akanthomyces muscarius TaxID=2231603 RepID=A0A9W8QLL0_AKAMU|nr:hypothetical protein LMH87_005325 [Akanthomyces muscarius]KAJ4163605.1 hypothetical protein LMH87_005325 [Akanthomyces muscarius]
MPTMDHSSLPSIWGRHDAEDESVLEFLNHIPDETGALKRRKRLPTDSPSPPGFTKSNGRWLDPLKDDLLNRLPSDAPLHTRRGTTMEPHEKQNVTPLLNLPAELLHAVLSYLAPFDLLNVTATCRTLREYAVSELHWHRCIQRNVPGVWLSTPGPCKTYRELYSALDRLWFLPRYKIWFSDRDLMGKLILARYDQRRGCIEAFQLLAVSRRDSYDHWPADKEVIIHGFEPKVNLHLDKPVLQFKVHKEGKAERQFRSRPGANRFADEMPMTLDDRLAGMYSNFMLTRPLDPEEADKSLSSEYPYHHIWPPPAIPARHHVAGIESGQAVVQTSTYDRPRRRCEVSDQTFRIRQWMELSGAPPPPLPWAAAPLPNSNGAEAPIGVHIGEEIVTYSTLDPTLYTPTATKPWRGIWVGDYSGHGCEFLLVNQPDDPPATDLDLGLERRDTETEDEWQKRRLNARVYRGRLEAIKLTGDPNIPRGEYTFVADDLGPAGYVGDAQDELFAGARIVRSKGHVAAAGFHRDKFIESQLILLSPNRLAQYWVGFGHISFFERVHIDELIKT